MTANFNALKFYDPSIVLNSANWIEFVSKFTELEYFKRSKYFRQIVFGHLNPKKQATISKFITSEIFRVVSTALGSASVSRCPIPRRSRSLSRLDLSRLKTSFYSHDELVFHVVEAGADAAQTSQVLHQAVRDIRTALETQLPQFFPFIRIELFQLRRVTPTTPFYIKETLDVAVKDGPPVVIERAFKCASSSFFAQVFKKYFGLPIVPFDRKVYFEGFVATLDTDIFDPASGVELPDDDKGSHG